ncbi:MAG: thioesterase [Erysipelotrichaceae bacterium]|nr:thioesterase [Erysipelotrichaceae bacterium]
MDEYMTYKKIEVDFGDVDYMGEYRINNIVDQFARIATNNATEYGFWNDTMAKHYGWVVAKQSLYLDKPICYKDIIELSTTFSHSTFVTFPRYYFINRDNQQIGFGTSIWTLIDIANRRIVAPKRIGIKVPQSKQLPTLDSPKDITIDIPLQHIQTRQVLYSDVDTNQHMNNVRYIDWALDLIDYKIHEKYFTSELHILYKKEIRPLTPVKLYIGQDNLRYIIEDKSEEDEQFFLIEIVFKER